MNRRSQRRNGQRDPRRSGPDRLDSAPTLDRGPERWPGVHASLVGIPRDPAPGPVVQRNGNGPTDLPYDLQDQIYQHLSAADLANLSMTNRTNRDRLAPVATQVLSQEIYGPPAEGADTGTSESSRSVGHMDTSSGLPARKKIDYLSERRQIVTRALNETDANSIATGRPMTGTGTSKDVAHQVATGNSALLSASEKPSHKFSKGSSGHVAIYTPQHYERERALSGPYPRTVPATIGDIERDAHRNRFVSHSDVLAAVSGNDQRNAREATEVMFQGPLPLEHVVHLDSGLPQGEIVKSKAALEREAERKEAQQEPDKGVLKHIRKARPDLGKEQQIALALACPAPVVLAGRKEIMAWARKQ